MEHPRIILRTFCHTSLHTSELGPYIAGAQTTKYTDGLSLQLQVSLNTRRQGEESSALMVVYLVFLFWRHFTKQSYFLFRNK